LKKALTIIANILFVLLILIGLFVAVTLLPIKNNIKIYAVHSGSMTPALPVGSLVIVQPVSNYKVDDIVTFLPSTAAKKSDTVTHRIVSKVESGRSIYFLTKGDANDDNDQGQISESQIKGKVITKVSYLGYIAGYLKTLPGLLLIIIIPATIIVYEEINKIKRELATIRKKRKEAKNENK
jgi:signal peptidase